MSEFTPPTTEAPTVDITEGIPIDLDRRERTLPQVMADAEQQGYPGLVGLTWDRGDLTYHVTEHRIQTKSTPVVKDRFFAGEISKDLGRLGQTFLGLKKPEYKKITYDTEDVDVWTVKAYTKDGELTNVRPFVGGEFSKFLYDKTRRNEENPEPISNLRWVDLPERPRPDPGDREDIDLDFSKPLLEQFMESQEEEGLPTMIGLTWSRDGFKHQIVDDMLMVKTFRTPDGSEEKRVFRLWVRDMYDQEGKIVGRSVFNGETLGKYFDQVAKSPSRGSQPPEDFHWEVPRPLGGPPELAIAATDRREGAGAGAVATRETVEMEAVEENISDKEAFKLLHYADLEQNRQQVESDFYSYKAAIDEMESFGEPVARTLSAHADVGRLDASTEEVGYTESKDEIRAFRRSVKKFGKEPIVNLATQLRDRCLEDMRLLGLTPNVNTASISWALRDLLPYIDPQKHENKDKSSDDIFGDSWEAQQLRREIVDVHLGWEFERSAWQAGTAATRMGMKDVLQANKDVVRRAQPFIQKAVRQMLNMKEADQMILREQYKGLKEQDHEKLGRLLRRSIGR